MPTRRTVICARDALDAEDLRRTLGIERVDAWVASGVRKILGLEPRRVAVTDRFRDRADAWELWQQLRYRAARTGLELPEHPKAGVYEEAA